MSAGEKRSPKPSPPTIEGRKQGEEQFFTSAQTTLQERTPLEVRGRVFAVQFLVANVVGLPPTLFIGTLADRIAIARVILLITGGVAVVGGLGTYFALTKRNQPEWRGNSR